MHDVRLAPTHHAKQPDEVEGSLESNRPQYQTRGFVDREFADLAADLFLI
jgi:hypothetical protein